MLNSVCKVNQHWMKDGLDGVRLDFLGIFLFLCHFEKLVCISLHVVTCIIYSKFSYLYFQNSKSILMLF